MLRPPQPSPPLTRTRSNSAWSRYGRWILLVAIIVVVLIIFFLFSFLNARRRRRRGTAPLRGTAWMAPQHGAVNYYGPAGPNNNNNTTTQYQSGYEQHRPAAPPAYGQNHGYYGQESGLEMQPPQQAYHGQGGTGAYAPPPGPPPGKDNIVR